MYLLRNYRVALRAPIYVHDKIHTAEAAAEAAQAARQFIQSMQNYLLNRGPN